MTGGGGLKGATRGPERPRLRDPPPAAPPEARLSSLASKNSSESSEWSEDELEVDDELDMLAGRPQQGH